MEINTMGDLGDYRMLLRSRINRTVSGSTVGFFCSVYYKLIISRYQFVKKNSDKKNSNLIYVSKERQ